MHYPNFNADRVLGFVGFLLSRRAPIHILDLAQETGYSRANAYRLIKVAQKHFPIDFNDATVTVRREFPCTRAGE